MNVTIEERDGKKVAVMSEADYNSLKDNFNKGYGKGTAAGRKEALAAFSDLEVDAGDFVETGKTDTLKASLGGIKDTLKKVADGKLVEAGKVGDKDGVIKDLQEKLQQKSAAFEKLEQASKDYKRSTLIDGKLKDLATGKKAFDADGEVTIFKTRFQLDVDENNNVTVKDNNGQPVFNEKGDAAGLETAFENFFESRKAYYEGSQSSGSGDKGGAGGGGKSYLDMPKEDFEKEVSNVKLGKNIG